MKADDLVKAAQREIAMRGRVYPWQIMRGKMKQTEADHQLIAADAWLTLSELAPQMIATLEAVAAYTPNTPGEIATRDLAEELLGKLRTIVDG